MIIKRRKLITSRALMQWVPLFRSNYGIDKMAHFPLFGYPFVGQLDATTYYRHTG